MQRVIEQLSETKDPRLFNKKINKLLDLFDKWECNMVEREHALLETAQRQSSQLEHFESQEMQMQQKEKELFEEKQQLEFELSALNQREQTLIEQRAATTQREALLHAQHQKLQAVLSRISEKDALLAAKKDSYNQRTSDFQREEQRIAAEKDAVMREWDEVIAQAQSIKRIEQDNQQLLQQLKETQEKISNATTLLDKKFESLHNMHEYQNYKQQIDDREAKLRLKEENIRLLQKELATLKAASAADNIGEQPIRATPLGATSQPHMRQQQQQRFGQADGSIISSSSSSSQIAPPKHNYPPQPNSSSYQHHTQSHNMRTQQTEADHSLDRRQAMKSKAEPSQAALPPYYQQQRDDSTYDAISSNHVNPRVVGIQQGQKEQQLNDSRQNTSHRMSTQVDDSRNRSNSYSRQQQQQQSQQGQPQQSQANRNTTIPGPTQPQELTNQKAMNQEEEREYLRNLLEKKQRLLQQYEEQSRNARNPSKNEASDSAQKQ